MMWPNPNSPWAFPAVIGGLVVIVVSMLYVFKRRGWW
jgi:Mg2+ and Co2+ transporter CorA